MYPFWSLHFHPNRWVSQIRVPLAACCKLPGSYNKLLMVLYVVEHKTQHLLIHVPSTRIVAFWHIYNTPQRFRKVIFVIVTQCFVKQQHLWNIAIQPEVGCCNVWANTRCLGCSPLGEKIIVKQDYSLTHWGRVTQICVSKLTIIGSDNGLLLGRLENGGHFVSASMC